MTHPNLEQKIMSETRQKALAALEAACEDLGDLHEAFERGRLAGRLQGLEEAATMIENAVMPEIFHKTGIYTELEQGADKYLEDMAAAIRKKIAEKS
jgi:hypothetical protein